MNTTWLTYSPHLGHRPEPQWFSGCSKSLDDWQNQLEIHGFWLCLFGSLGSSGWSRWFFFVLATHSWRLTFRKGGYFQHLSATWHCFHEESRPKNQGSCSISSGILVTGHWREPEGNPKGKPEGKTRRENPKDCRNITTFITTPFCFVWWRSCFFKQRLHS
jgi:hypothetical protein